MYQTDKSVLYTGIVMILLAIGLVVLVAAFSSTGDSDPFDDAKVAEYLQDVNDNEASVIVAGAVGMINDGVLAVALGGLLYVLFRDRSRLLALLIFGGILVSSAAALMTDVSTILQTIPADDFVNGGPAGMAAGDTGALEVGRILGVLSFAMTNVSFTALGVAFVGLGAIIAFAPEGAINPPKPIGWIVLLSGLCCWLAWLVVATDAGFIFFIGQGLTSLIFLLWLGTWLIMHRDLQPAA